jgi:hypothetical protein
MGNPKPSQRPDSIEYIQWLTKQVKQIQSSTPTWYEPTLLNGWENYGAGWTPASYGRDSQGFIHLRGLIKSGTVTASTVLFVLPTDFRPTLNAGPFITISNGAASRVDVLADGSVTIEGTTSNVYLSLNTIYFYADG